MVASAVAVALAAGGFFSLVMVAIYLLVAGKERANKIQVRAKTIVTTFKDANDEDEMAIKKPKSMEIFAFGINSLWLWHDSLYGPIHSHDHAPNPIKQHLKIKLCNPVFRFGQRMGGPHVGASATPRLLFWQKCCQHTFWCSIFSVHEWQVCACVCVCVCECVSFAFRHSCKWRKMRSQRKRPAIGALRTFIVSSSKRYKKKEETFLNALFAMLRFQTTLRTCACVYLQLNIL